MNAIIGQLQVGRSEAESRLRQAEALVHDLVERSADGVIVVDGSRTVRYANPAACRLIARDPSDVLDEPLGFSVTPGETTELEVVARDGARRAVEMRVVEGAWEGEAALLLSLRDVTERRDAEDALRAALDESRRRHRQTESLLGASRSVLRQPHFEAAARAVCEATRGVLAVSGAWLQLVDRSSGRPGPPIVRLGQGARSDALDAPPTVLDALAQDALESLDPQYANVLDAAEAAGPANGLVAPLVVGGRAEGLLTLVDKPGGFGVDDVRVVSAMAEMAAAALRGRPMLDALRDSEERYRSIYDAAPSLICSVDQAGLIASCNPRITETLGYELLDLVGRSLDVLIYPEDVEQARRCLAQANTGLQVTSCPLRLVRRDGSALEVNLNAATVPDGDTKGLHTVLLLSDLTEQRRLEAQLRQAAKMEAIGQLAGGVAHDFNNLLTVINGYSAFLLDALDPHDPLYEDIDSIARAGERAAELTRQLLAFARRQMQERRLVDLNAILTDLSGMLQRLIGEDIDLQLHLCDDLCPVLADPGQLGQVVMNLAVNSRDAMPSGGLLIIETENVPAILEDVVGEVHVGGGPYVTLTVTDTGEGMSAETVQHVFEPFYTTKGAGKGTGLGLATVYGIVRQSDGHISLESSPGAGTTFRVYLPRAEETPGDGDDPPQATQLPEGSETVLVVEDQPQVLGLTAHMLRRLGYNVLTAASGPQALARVRSYSDAIHLLLTDVVLPDMNGRELAERLSRLRPRMRILFMSGYTDGVIDGHGVLDPGVELLKKPFTIGTLARQVRAVLGERIRTAP